MSGEGEKVIPMWHFASLAPQHIWYKEFTLIFFTFEYQQQLSSQTVTWQPQPAQPTKQGGQISTEAITENQLPGRQTRRPNKYKSYYREPITWQPSLILFF